MSYFRFVMLLALIAAVASQQDAPGSTPGQGNPGLSVFLSLHVLPGLSVQVFNVFAQYV